VKNPFSTIFKSTSVEKPPVFGAVFAYFRQLQGLFASFNSLHRTVCAGIPPASPQYAKQFLNRTHGL
jgi:hypothetical protein